MLGQRFTPEEEAGMSFVEGFQAAVRALYDGPCAQGFDPTPRRDPVNAGTQPPEGRGVVKSFVGAEIYPSQAGEERRHRAAFGQTCAW
jgi:hypothetical protein